MKLTFCAELLYANFVTIYITNHFTLAFNVATLVTFQNMENFQSICFNARSKTQEQKRIQKRKWKIQSQFAANKLWEIISKHMCIKSTEEPRVKLFRMSKSETFEPYALFSPDYEPTPEFDYQVKITCFGLTVHLTVYVRLGEDDDEDDLMLVMDRPDDTKLYFNIFDRDGVVEKKHGLLKTNGADMCKEIIDMIGLKDIIDEYELFENLISNISLSIESEVECECDTE